MPANVSNNLLSVKGVRLSAVSAGIKSSHEKDLVLIEIAEEASLAAVFTQNTFCAAPVTVAKQHLAQTKTRYLLINSGNANAGLGEQGMNAALNCCQALASIINIDKEQVLPFSTGVIGEPLPVKKISDALPVAVEELTEENWFQAAQGIMTTDTRAKGFSYQFEHDGETITVTGVAKGAGMIKPNMATMLAFIATDAPVVQSVLQAMLRSIAEKTFNRVTVDGDTSTNDACVLIATGKSNLSLIKNNASESYHKLFAAIHNVCMILAQDIIKDAEGATKFVKVTVQGGETNEECLQVAYSVAHSPLVKTALFASDPNWGRILAAVGNAGVQHFSTDLVSILLNDLCIVEQGARATDYNENQAAEQMAQDDIVLTIDLGRGDMSETIFTCDLSYDYVKINAEYRT